jgi:hypothetical protein
MKRNTLSALLGLALAAAPAAQAAESPLSYTYVEANYVDTSLDLGDGTEVSGNGFGLNGSIAFGDTGFYGLAAYETVGEEVGGIDVDINRMTAGAGYALKIDERLHALLEVAYLDYDFDVDVAGFGSGSAGADGYRANIGLRGLMADNIEGVAKVGYAKVEEEGVELYDGAIGELGFRWHIDPAWSAGLAAEFAEDETTYKLGLRLQW